VILSQVIDQAKSPGGDERRKALEDGLRQACSSGAPDAVTDAARALRLLLEQNPSPDTDPELARVALIEGSAALEARRTDEAIAPLERTVRVRRTLAGGDPGDGPRLQFIEALLMLARAHVARRETALAEATMADAETLAAALRPAVGAHLLPLVQLHTLKAALAIGTDREATELEHAIALLSHHGDPHDAATQLMTLQYSMRLAHLHGAAGEADEARAIAARCQGLVDGLAERNIPARQLAMLREGVAGLLARLGEHNHHDHGPGHDHGHAHGHDHEHGDDCCGH
jgi:hypothetical protein